MRFCVPMPDKEQIAANPATSAHSTEPSVGRPLALDTDLQCRYAMRSDSAVATTATVVDTWKLRNTRGRSISCVETISAIAANATLDIQLAVVRMPEYLFLAQRRRSDIQRLSPSRQDIVVSASSAPAQRRRSASSA
jgi:hypothetical protein